MTTTGQTSNTETKTALMNRYADKSVRRFRQYNCFINVKEHDGEYISPDVERKDAHIVRVDGQREQS